MEMTRDLASLYEVGRPAGLPWCDTEREMPALRLIALAMASFAAYGQTTAPVAPAQTVRISGQVFDSRGEPLPNASVSIWVNGASGSVTLAAVSTGCDGRFALTAAQAQLYLRVQAIGWRRPAQSVDARDGRDVDLGALMMIPTDPDVGPCMFNTHQLDRAGGTYRVSGRVVDPQGAAVADAAISLKGTCEYFSTKTGRDGTFSLRHVPRMELLLQVLGPGFHPACKPVQAGVAHKNTGLGTIVVVM
jgi:hypothetical protein